MIILKQINFNEYAIKLKDNKQLYYISIYNLSLVELKILKTYIKTHLKIKFIWLSKSSISAFILFDKRPNNSFYLFIDY